jgi:hypothetical protein
MCAYYIIRRAFRVRTTTNPPDSLMCQIRKRADRDNRTITSMVEQARRKLLARDQTVLQRSEWTGGRGKC